MRKERVILWLACSTVFFEAFDVSIVSLSLHTIGNDLGVSLVSAQWIQTLYLTCFGGFLLLGGRLCDRFDSRSIFLAGMFLFGMASMIGSFSHNLSFLLIARGGQGLGASLALPAGIALISRYFEEGVKRNRALGLFGASAAIGFANGLSIGGILTSFFDWHWIFGINVPAILLILIAGFIIIPRQETNNQKKLNWFVACWLVATLLVLCYSIHELPLLRENAALLFVGAGTSLWALVRYDAKQEQPFFEKRVFRNKNFLKAQIGSFFLGTCFLSIVTLVVQTLSLQFAFSNYRISLFLVPFSIFSVVVTKYLLPLLLKYFEVTRVGQLALLFLFFGAVLLVGGKYWNSLPMLVFSTLSINSFAIAIGYPAFSILSLTGVERTDQGTAAGMQTSIYTVGSSLGLSILGLILQTNINSRIWTAGTTAGISIAVFTVVAVLLLSIKSTNRSYGKH